MTALKQKASNNAIDHLCEINYIKNTGHRRKVGIIGTIGPSSRNVETIVELMRAGMNVARINFAHETREDHILSFKCIAEAEKIYSRELGYYYPLGVAADLKGRVIRTGLLFSRKPIDVKTGDTLKISINEALAYRGTKEVIYADFPGIIKNVEVGQHIFMDENALSVVITEVGVDCLVCRILKDGQLRGYMSVVVPGTVLDMPVISEKDAEDIKLSMDKDVDFFFLSKMRNAQDVELFKKKLGERDHQIKIFTKLENVDALKNLEEILHVSDGVILARADMAIELTNGQIVLAQKAITARCNRMGKPIIIATQLLMSMNASSVPQRSDIADVCNAIIDGADSLLLSSETGIGMYPVEVVKTLDRSSAEAEAAVWHQRLFKDLIDHSPSVVDSAHAIAICAVRTAAAVSATAIFVMTVSGKSAQLVSIYRPFCPIFAVIRNAQNARQLSICRGLFPILLLESDRDKRLNDALALARKMGIVKSDDAVIVVAPIKTGAGYSNNVSVIYAQFHKTT